MSIVSSPKNFRLSTAYKRDYRLVIKRGCDCGLLEALLTKLSNGHRFEAHWCDHPLRGEWRGYRECHIEPNWLLIYKITDSEVLLARTGTHPELFK